MCGLHAEEQAQPEELDFSLQYICASSQAKEELAPLPSAASAALRPVPYRWRKLFPNHHFGRLNHQGGQGGRLSLAPA
jgi:hypothetical protein